jgi:capsule biosynthesis phosphatase
MIETEKALVVDVDGTLCPIKRPGENYADLVPEPRMLARLRALRAEGWHIILHSARGMRSNDGNLGRIGRTVAPGLLDWLARHDIPFDELHLGKPWPGRHGFYIDDRAVRPREFLELDFDQLAELVERDRVAHTPAAGEADADDAA